MRRYAALGWIGVALIAGMPGGGWADAFPAPEYRLPWEIQADKADKAAKVEAVEADPIEIESGAMTIVRLIRAGSRIVSSHPEVADIYIEKPDMLFVFGRTPGSTRLVVADSASQVVWEGTVVVHPEEDKASSPLVGVAPAAGVSGH